MIWMNYVFTGGSYSLDCAPSINSSYSNLEISAAGWHELYASSDTTKSLTGDIPQSWAYDTIFHGTFQNTLAMGNVPFFVQEVSQVLVKRRVVGSLDWVTISTINVTSAADLSFEMFDTTTKSNTLYEYTVVPIVGGVEGTSNSVTVTTDFPGLFIVSPSTVVGTELDVSVTCQRNRPSSVVNTIGRKYPFVISNSMNDYDSGHVAATWLAYNAFNDSWDIDNAFEYRDIVKDVLYSGAPIIIKLADGRMWLAGISGAAIMDTPDGVTDKVTTEFDWTEVGDASKEEDLKSYGFIV